jgi:hypothetical protein
MHEKGTLGMGLGIKFHHQEKCGKWVIHESPPVAEFDRPGPITAFGRFDLKEGFHWGDHFIKWEGDGWQYFMYKWKFNPKIPAGLVLLNLIHSNPCLSSPYLEKAFTHFANITVLHTSLRMLSGL